MAGVWGRSPQELVQQLAQIASDQIADRCEGRPRHGIHLPDAQLAIEQNHSDRCLVDEEPYQFMIVSNEGAYASHVC